MIRIIDYETGKDFDLPKGLKIAIDKNNPLLSDDGTTSLSITLPDTDTNRILLDNTQRWDRAFKIKRSRKVVLIAGIFQRNAVMTLTQGTSVTLLFDESVMYAAMKNVDMTDVFDGIIRDDFASLTTVSQRVAAWSEYLTRVWRRTVSDQHFEIFPVCTEQNETDGHGFLNQIKYTGTGIAFDKTDFCLAGMYEREFTINEAKVTIPVGYQITPFLKYRYVLKTLFAHFGFVLNEDLYTRYPDFDAEVLLNNVGDSIMFGYINFGQMVPTKTVPEFLSAFANKYGCDFFVSDDGITINVVFWNELLENTDMNITPLSASKPIPYFENFKQLKLTCDTNNVITSSTYKNLTYLQKNYVDKRYFDYSFLSGRDIYAWNTELIKTYVDASAVEAECIANSKAYLGSIVFLQAEQYWYKREYYTKLTISNTLSVKLQAIIEEPALETLSVKCTFTDSTSTEHTITLTINAGNTQSEIYEHSYPITLVSAATCSSDLYDYPFVYYNIYNNYHRTLYVTDTVVFRKIDYDAFSYMQDFAEDDNLDTKEVTGNHEFVQQLLVDMNVTKDTSKQLSFFSDLFTTEFFIPYIGSPRYLNTTLYIDDTAQNSETDECGIMSCFQIALPESAVGEFMCSYGTTYCFDIYGNKLFSFSMNYGGFFGLFEMFWKKYNEVLLNSFQPVQADINLSQYGALKYKMEAMKMLTNQPLIPESLKYEITDTEVTVIESTFRTRKLYM